MTKGIIGYITPSSGYPPGEQGRRLQQLRGSLPPGFRVDQVTLTETPPFLDTEADFESAGTIIAEYLGNLDSHKFDAVVLAGALDPGLRKLRVVSPVPVVGPGEASLFVASVLNRPASIVVVDDVSIPLAQQLVANSPCHPPILSIRSMNKPIRDIVEDLSEARDALMHEIIQSREADGAECVILGAMTLGSLDDSSLRASVNVPIINPMKAALSAAVLAVDANLGFTVGSQ